MLVTIISAFATRAGKEHDYYTFWSCSTLFRVFNKYPYHRKMDQYNLNDGKVHFKHQSEIWLDAKLNNMVNEVTVSILNNGYLCRKNEGHDCP